jgi:hypothetical protein
VKTLCDDYKLTFNDPDPIDNFLGIHFSHQDNGELHMSQTGFIDAMTESAHIPKGRLKNTPTAATAILHADTDGLARQESWNYPSVIGQLNFFAHNSRPDISFAVHQYAQISKEPKALHEKAVKHIIYYLQYTRDKPLIMKPKKIFHLMHTATATLLVYGTNNSHIYAISAYHAHALSLSWLVSQYIGRANYKPKYN